jgi:hypothetical protein
MAVQSIAVPADPARDARARALVDQVPTWPRHTLKVAWGSFIPNADVTAEVPAVRTLTFDEIHERVAAHHAAEAGRNAPKPTAIRAVFTLASLLADLDATDRAQVLNLLRDEVLSLPVTA